MALKIMRFESCNKGGQAVMRGSAYGSNLSLRIQFRPPVRKSPNVKDFTGKIVSFEEGHNWILVG